MEKVFPPGWFNVMQYLLVYLPWEARVGGPVLFKWMYNQERELKKLRSKVRNKARVERCIMKAFTCKNITNLSSMYFSYVNNVNAHTTRYHVLGLLVHIMSLTRSGIIPGFTCTQIWRKANHILRSLTKHTGHLVNTLHWSNWITCASMGSKVVQAFRSGSGNM
jgi:hypothetical protein